MNGLRAPVLVVWLTALWVLLWGDLTVQNLAAGLVIAVVVVVIAWPTGTRFTAPTSFHPVAALRYLVYFAGQLVVSSLVVAREVVTPRNSLNRAIVAVPMHTASAGINTLVANCVTLTPGTITVDVSRARTRDRRHADAVHPRVALRRRRIGAPRRVPARALRGGRVRRPVAARRTRRGRTVMARRRSP